MAPSILIIDDDDGIVEALTDVLQDAGYRVETAYNGEVGLARLRREGPPIDAILLDLNMPVMGGIEFRRRALEDERLSAIPVIVLSAGLQPRDLAALQVSAYLSKTTPVPELLATIARVTARH
jgi:CheY-like chemotaxis protein